MVKEVLCQFRSSPVTCTGVFYLEKGVGVSGRSSAAGGDRMWWD